MDLYFILEGGNLVFISYKWEFGRMSEFSHNPTGEIFLCYGTVNRTLKSEFTKTYFPVGY